MLGANKHYENTSLVRFLKASEQPAALYYCKERGEYQFNIQFDLVAKGSRYHSLMISKQSATILFLVGAV
jgi:hypothetical protein